MIPTLVRRVDERRRSGRRHARLRAAAMVLTLTAMLLGTALIAAAESPVSRPSLPSPSSFAATAPSTVDQPRPDAAMLRLAPLATTPLAPLLGGGAPSAVTAGRPQPATSPMSRPTIAPKTARPKAVAVVRPTRLRARGDATWYCRRGVSACQRDHAGGLYAAAGAALRVGDWRGRVVTVCRSGRCVRVTLIDWCACGGGRVIDLYGDAFRRLAPLSSGVLRVSVRW